MPLRVCAITTVGRPGAEALGGQAVGVGQFAGIVAVDFNHVPAERKPVIHVRRGHDFEDGAVDAEAVVVQRDDQVFHAEIRRQIARFVRHAFFGLGIACDHERARGEPAGAMQRGEAQARGDAVAGRTGGRVGERIVALHVAAGSAPFAEAGEILGIDRHARVVAGERVALAAQRLVDQRQQRVKQRTAVAGRPHHAVAARLPWDSRRRKPSAPEASSVTTCSALDDDPPGWPDCAPSTAANSSPRTTRHRLAMRASSISGSGFQRQAAQVEVGASLGVILEAVGFGGAQGGACLLIQKRVRCSEGGGHVGPPKTEP